MKTRSDQFHVRADGHSYMGVRTEKGTRYHRVDRFFAKTKAKNPSRAVRTMLLRRLKKKGYTYDRKKKIWSVIDLSKLKEDALDAFREWGGSRPQIQRKLVRSLEHALPSLESDGTVQINSLGTDGKTLKKNDIKLRWNPSQRKLTIYLRNYVYKFRGNKEEDSDD